jgi:hypothetical protein
VKIAQNGVESTKSGYRRQRKYARPDHTVEYDGAEAQFSDYALKPGFGLMVIYHIN